MSYDETILSDRATVEWFPNSEPPVYLIRTTTDSGRVKEMYLEPEEMESLVEFYESVLTT